MKTCENCHWYRIEFGKTPCKVFDGSGCEHWQPMTNGDVLRASDDVQLARKIADMYDYLPGIRDEYLPGCATDPDTDKSLCIAFDCCHCPATILKWLKGEVDYDDEDD